MRYCSNCQASVKGDWVECPLCTQTLPTSDQQTNEASDFIEVPLFFDRTKARHEFMWTALAIILLYIVVSLFYDFQFFGFQYVVFGLLITWIVVFVLFRKRQNMAKAIVYLLVLISLVSVFFDYSNGWMGWSLTFVIPILSMASLIAIIIGIQTMEIRLNDYILYLQLVALLGLTPLLFLIMDWVAHPLPSILSVVLSVIVFLAVFFRYRKLLIKELNKRLHL